MPLLRAHFSLQVSSPCLLTFPEEHQREVGTTFDGFHVTVKLLPVWDRRHKAENDSLWTTALAGMNVTVSRDETEALPLTITKAGGAEDLTLQREYLLSRLPSYRAAALEISNCVLKYFKYSLRTPEVNSISKYDRELHNPIWRDAFGEEIKGRPIILMSPADPAQRAGPGTQSLTREGLPALQAFITNPTDPSLTVALLSDAQTALVGGSLQRAVLELAISVEVMAKRRILADTSSAGAESDYPENNPKGSVKVIDLIDKVANEAFGKSYKKLYPSHYRNIDFLFRCRNKIAHRGELNYRDDSANWVAVDGTMVEAWWYSANDLKCWLESL